MMRVSTVNASIMPTMMIAITARRGINTASGSLTTVVVDIEVSDVTDGWESVTDSTSIVSVISITSIDADNESIV